MWVLFSGGLVKAPPEGLRLATEDETLGWEFAMEDLEQRGASRRYTGVENLDYEDLRRQTVPERILVPETPPPERPEEGQSKSTSDLAPADQLPNPPNPVEKPEDPQLVEVQEVPMPPSQNEPNSESQKRRDRLMELERLPECLRRPSDERPSKMSRVSAEFDEVLSRRPEVSEGAGVRFLGRCDTFPACRS